MPRSSSRRNNNLAYGGDDDPSSAAASGGGFSNVLSHIDAGGGGGSGDRNRGGGGVGVAGRIFGGLLSDWLGFGGGGGGAGGGGSGASPYGGGGYYGSGGGTGGGKQQRNGHRLNSRFVNNKKIAAVAAALILTAAAVGFLARARYRGGGSAADGQQSGANLPIVSPDGKFNGRYPNSLLTLFYPYTLFRDIILDQPVSESDVAFFWHVHKSDERIVKDVLTSCFGLDLVELNDKKAIKRAIDVNLVSGLTRRHVVTSPFIRETAEIFTMENFGRMFAVWRHPLDYDVHPSLPTFSRPDNWLVRLLSNDHDGDLEFKELGVAKKVIHQTNVVATVDKLTPSLVRIAGYFGWDYAAGKDEQCIESIVDEHNIDETYIDHESEQWNEFYKLNKYDCQLYEIAQSCWRAQMQTCIPYKLQLQRAEPEKEEDEEEEGGDE